jgi:hypothetical protein
MLVALHIAVGLVVVAGNAAAALWLARLDRANAPVAGRPGQLLAAARAALALQILLGVALAAGGAVGVAPHYLAAMGAGAAAWLGFTRQREAARPARVAAVASAVAALLALAALLLAWL